MAAVTHSGAAGYAGFAPFRPFARLFQAFSVMRERAHALRELSAMSDAELADIGLSRSDLPHLFDRR